MHSGASIELERLQQEHVLSMLAINHEREVTDLHDQVRLHQRARLTRCLAALGRWSKGPSQVQARYPAILKADVGEHGKGVDLVHSREEASIAAAPDEP